MTTAAIRSVGHIPSKQAQEESKGTSIGEKIKNVVLKIIKFIGKILTFPFRYFGSKTWSIPGLIIRTPYVLFKRAIGIKSDRTLKEELFGTGYNFGFEKKLNKEELKPFFPYACAAAAINSSKPEWVEPTGYRVLKPKDFNIKHGNIQANETCFFDPKSGLKVSVMEKENDVIIAFGPLDSHKSEVGDKTKEDKRLHSFELKNAVGNLVGFCPEVYRFADHFFAVLKEHPSFKGKKITLAGQCYGGAIAQYLALKHQMPAYCFNSVSLGAGLQYKLGDKALREADKYVTHLSIRGDYLTDQRVIGVGDRLLSGLGVRTPGNFGKRYLIPSAYKNGHGAHSFVLGSMMHHLGHDVRAKPAEIYKDGVIKVK